MSELVFIPLCLLAFLIALLAVYNNIVVVKKYKITSDKLKDALRIVLVSDLHNKKGAHRIVKKIEMQKPDIIVVAGDLVDRRKPDFDISRNFLHDISQITDTYYVTGNHERALGLADSIDRLECAEVLLNDDYKIFEHYSILGLSDTVGISDNTQKDVVSLFSRLENYKIVVVHRPTQIDSHLCLSDYDVDLLLCGHTHGGCVRIPFFGAVISPDEGFFPKYSKGIYEKNGTKMVISGGIGNTFLPLRINNFGEIVVIDIN